MSASIQCNNGREALTGTRENNSGEWDLAECLCEGVYLMEDMCRRITSKAFLADLGNCQIG